jgi:hypothetical protein
MGENICKKTWQSRRKDEREIEGKKRWKRR